MNSLASACIFAILGLSGCGSVVQSNGPAPFQGEPDLKVDGVRRATALSVADLNRDGKFDLVMIASETGKLTLLLQTRGKSLAFVQAAAVDAGKSASDLVIGDLNEDSKQDIAVCHHDTDEIWLLMGKGDGTFDPPRKVHVPVTEPHAHRIAATDFNKDKHLDLLLAESDDNRACVLLGDGKGGFNAASGSPISTGRHPYVVQLGDFNRDGAMDFATPNWFDKSVSVLLGDSHGRFRKASGSPLSGFTAPTAMAAGDLNGDGNLDVVVGNNGERGLQVMVGDGKGGFKLGVMRDLDPDGPCFQPEIADLNGDGKLDVLATSTNGARTFSYWLNHGGGNFGRAVPLSCPSGANTICVADLNGDGRLDVAVGTWDGDKTLIWLGRKRG